ncbi:MAG: hypothetical protein Q4G44_00270 [Alcaligenaceae bacterium]|nr:hypothetical protein [Alcaligenaceae bacterium]
MKNFKDKVADLLAWINRRWILLTVVLTVIFWIVSSNILIGFMVAFFVVAFLIMIHALIQLTKAKDSDDKH